MVTMTLCGAKNRQHRPCGRHVSPGKSRCYYHGGAPGSGGQPGNQNALKHGFYASRHGVTSKEQTVIAASVSVPPERAMLEDMGLMRVLVRRVVAARDLAEPERAEVVGRALERVGRLVKTYHRITSSGDATALQQLDASADAVMAARGGE